MSYQHGPCCHLVCEWAQFRISSSEPAFKDHDWYLYKKSFPEVDSIQIFMCKWYIKKCPHTFWSISITQSFPDWVQDFWAFLLPSVWPAKEDKSTRQLWLFIVCIEVFWCLKDSPQKKSFQIMNVERKEKWSLGGGLGVHKVIKMDSYSLISYRMEGQLLYSMWAFIMHLFIEITS